MALTNQNGKGCKPRPLSVSREQYEANWDKLFGTVKKEDTHQKKESKQ